MTKQKIILTGLHGRPSTKLAWSNVNINKTNPITLVQKRRIPGTTKIYYRVFGDPSLYKEEQKYQLKIKNFKFDNSVIIRWGTREELEMKNSIIYNKSSSIKNATDKFKSRLIFREKGVISPKLILNPLEYREGTIVIARPHVHSKGKNFKVIKNYEQLVNHWREGWYYSEFVDKIREFRVHVGHSKVLALMEKHDPNNGNIAWNRAINDSQPFTSVKAEQADNEKLRSVLIEAIKAVNALELDMGGVDVILDANGVAYVLEVNTAPTLNSSPAVAKKWAKYWEWLLREDGRREHWDYKVFKKASSLYWKNFQLDI